MRILHVYDSLLDGYSVKICYNNVDANCYINNQISINVNIWSKVTI